MLYDVVDLCDSPQMLAVSVLLVEVEQVLNFAASVDIKCNRNSVHKNRSQGKVLDLELKSEICEIKQRHYISTVMKNVQLIFFRNQE